MPGIEALYHPFNLCGSYPRVSIQTRKLSIHKSLVSCSKKLDYQDFQGYATPLRLLPVTEPSICTLSSVEEISGSLRGGSQSVYVVKLCTSTMFGSGLSDLSAGILLCLIDEKGDSVLQRIPATPVGTPMKADLPVLCFQRGSVDQFVFRGPKLGRIQSLWLGLESGSWRLGGLSLTVVHGPQGPSNDAAKDSAPNEYCGFQCSFEVDDILVGEEEGMSMVELKPCHCTELSGVELPDLPDTGLSQTNSLLSREVSNQESMEEYADLKSSLLLYDSMLILAGTLIAAISSGEETALAFLTGGAGGFLYLLLLQKSVDGLPAPAASSSNKDENIIDQFLKRLKGPVSSLALAFAFAGVAVKYGSGATAIELTPQEILVGMAGFLACKLAVLLAAFKPMQMKLKEK